MNRSMKPAKAALLLGLCLLALPTEARQLTSQVTEMDAVPRLRPEYPMPDEPDMLFYIQRSTNANTVVYAAKRDANGAIDSDTPVEGFWRWFNVDGAKKPLNFIERMMAYGVKNSHVAPGRPITFQITSLPERTLTLDMDKDHHPEALIQIGTHTARLVYVYLNVVEGGLMPKVPSLDIFAVDKSSGKALREHIVQN
jgi:Domain of unknown function (DUF4833)